jgi:hypothetical protein
MTSVCNQYYLSPDIRQTLRSNQCCINGSPSGQSGKLFLQDNVQDTAIQQALGHCILMAIGLLLLDHTMKWPFRICLLFQEAKQTLHHNK